MKRNPTIDLLKLVFSFGVIGIHAQLFKEINTPLWSILTMGLFRIGVPFFFVTSGYFYYQKIVNQQEIKPYILKLVKLFLMFEVMEVLIYTPFIIQGGNVLNHIWSALSVGLGGAYWYITSTIITLLLVTPLWKKKKIIPTLLVGLIFHFIILTNDSYSSFFQGTWIQEIAKIHTSIWRWPQAGLGSSLFYLSLGAYLFEKEPKIKQINFLLMGSMIGLMIEAYFLQMRGANDGNGYLFLFICAPLLFMYAKQRPINLDFPLMGKMSLYVYMIHPFFLIVSRIIVSFIYPSNELAFIFCSLLTVTLSFVISKKDNKYI